MTDCFTLAPPHSQYHLFVLLITESGIGLVPMRPVRCWVGRYTAGWGVRRANKTTHGHAAAREKQTLNVCWTPTEFGHGNHCLERAYQSSGWLQCQTSWYTTNGSICRKMRPTRGAELMVVNFRRDSFCRRTTLTNKEFEPSSTRTRECINS